jgi:spoIIIJ-associated protein
METIEIVASSVEEAVERAATQLGVDVADVKSEVIDESKGLFGKPGKVTVKAWAVAKAAPKAEKPAKAAKAEAPAKVEEAPVAEVAAEEEKPKRRTRTKKEDTAEAPAPKEEKTESESSEEPQGEVVASEEDAEKLLGILRSLLAAGDMRAEATISEMNGRYVHIDIDGQDVGFLIGRRGEVLNSIQYLMNVISARQLNNGVRVVVEGDNYRERRAEALGDMARRIAAQVLDRGEEAVLDALPAFERRVIHQALVDMEGINTYSEGEEPDRCVVIAPAG